LKPQKWSPQAFVHILKLPDSTAKRRAYQALKELLDKSGRKALREWETFTSFCQAAGFAIDPADVVMLDPSTSSPPPPDLKCNIGGLPQFFELGEIIQQDIAWALSRHESQAVVEPHLPLDTCLEPLEIILNKKLNNTYDPQARPISLLLYYAYGPIFWKLLRPLVVQKTVEFRARFEASVYSSIYLYDATKQEILFDFSQSFAPVVT
jgi:hypothetical protein